MNDCWKCRYSIGWDVCCSPEIQVGWQMAFLKACLYFVASRTVVITAAAPSLKAVIQLAPLVPPPLAYMKNGIEKASNHAAQIGPARHMFELCQVKTKLRLSKRPGDRTRQSEQEHKRQHEQSCGKVSKPETEAGNHRQGGRGAGYGQHRIMGDF